MKRGQEDRTHKHRHLLLDYPAAAQHRAEDGVADLVGGADREIVTRRLHREMDNAREPAVAARIGRGHRVDRRRAANERAIDRIHHGQERDVREQAAGILADEASSAAELPIPESRIALLRIDLAEAASAQGQDRLAVGG